MSKKLQFVWIDDESKRRKSATTLETQMGVKCAFIDVAEESVNYLSDINKLEPDLIIVDHNLNNIHDDKIKKGSTIAALIRESHPKSAIVCITGQESTEISSYQKQSYDHVFSDHNIKEHYPEMKAIAESYRKLKSSASMDIDKLFFFMKTPQEEIVRLQAILPHEIKENFQDNSLFYNISHWIRNILMQRPGFLYDRLWTATFLGLNDEGFRKVEKLFASAKYAGIFANDSNERWWKSLLLELLAQYVDSPGLPWERGRKLKGIKPKHYSKDFYSNYLEDFPETVAYTDETGNQREPMKIKYTIPHPRFEKLLFFEDIRMMKID